ncbi:MAG: XRE family transcriptional regulator [Clostridia bacterium]|nr:XRE family transcriptional regulator [Clostridia bacterium]
MNPSQKLGLNIRFYRKLKNFTQAELAEKLFVTPQSLSKWEKGLANPDIWNLLRLAEIFGVSCDRLLGNSENEIGKIMLAVDGGGTKTEFLMFNNEGEIISRSVSSASNPNVCGFDNALICLKDGIAAMLAENSNVSSVFLGIAGCGLPENRKAVQNTLRGAFPGVEIEVQSDLYNVVHTAEIAESYISVICGTGSSICVKTPKGLQRIGGYGYLFDKTYNGFFLGKEAIAEALAFYDGKMNVSTLTSEVEEILGGKAKDKLNNIYSLGNDYIASFSKAVFNAYDKGDRCATEIIENSIEALAKQITHAASLLSGEKNVILSGGLTHRSDILIPLLRKHCPNIKFTITDIPQIYGAAVYCAKKNGCANKSFKDKLKKSYFEMSKEQNNA